MSRSSTEEEWRVTTFANKAALDLKDRIQQKLPEVHVEAMQGEAPLLPLIREVSDKEQDLIGDERERILRYTGGAAWLAAQGDRT
jgi:ATP-dependent exoDNAse (exonuclease V) beta subunit